MPVDISGGMLTPQQQRQRIIEEMAAQSQAVASQADSTFQSAQDQANSAFQYEQRLRGAPADSSPPWSAILPVIAAGLAQHLSNRPFATQAIEMLQRHQEEISKQRIQSLSMAHDASQALAKQAERAGLHAETLKNAAKADSLAKQLAEVVRQEHIGQSGLKEAQQHRDRMEEIAARHTQNQIATDPLTKTKLHGLDLAYRSKLQTLQKSMAYASPNGPEFQAAQAAADSLNQWYTSESARIMGTPSAPAPSGPSAPAAFVSHTPQSALALLNSIFPNTPAQQIVARPDVIAKLKLLGLTPGDILKVAPKQRSSGVSFRRPNKLPEAPGYGRSQE